MKRIIKIVLVLLMLFALGFWGQGKPQKVYALADIDQSCQYGVTPPQYAWMSHEPIQTFIPTKGMLDAVGVYVKPEIGTSVPIKLEVTSENAGGAVIASSTQTIPDSIAWVTFDLSDVATPLGLYGIQLSDADPNKKAIWYLGTGTCYDRGFAIWDNTAHQEVDFRFATYGFNPEGSNPSQTSSSDQGNTDSSISGNLGTYRGTGSVPAANTSSAITAPTNLVATNESNYTGTGIRLNWTSSTTSTIDGYKIFRSGSASGGFTEISRTINGVTIYIDSTATIGQTYYYMVRAYKGNTESASSNVASATTKDTFKEDILKDHEANSGGVFGGLVFTLVRFLVPAIIFGLIFILVIVGIILLVRRNRQNKADQNQVEKK